MAYKKNYTYKRRNEKNYNHRKSPMKKYSFIDRMNYYDHKANYGKTAKEQDYAYGYLDGMRGVRGNNTGTDACEAGNKAGLRFWDKITKIKL